MLLPQPKSGATSPTRGNQHPGNRIGAQRCEPQVTFKTQPGS